MQFLIDNDEEKDGDEDDDEVLQSFFPFDACIALAHCRHFGIVY